MKIKLNLMEKETYEKTSSGEFKIFCEFQNVFFYTCKWGSLSQNSISSAQIGSGNEPFSAKIINHKYLARI